MKNIFFISLLLSFSFADFIKISNTVVDRARGFTVAR